MKTKVIIFSVAFAVLSFAVPRMALADPAIEQTLRDLDAQWSAAAAGKNLEKTVSYYSSDAIVLAPNLPIATTRDTIRELWNGFITTLIKGSWKATRVEVAKSGDMAYVSGTYEWSYKDENDKTVDDRGKYLEVWKKQADGSWKCGADCWNSDLPVPTAKQ